MPIFAKAFLFVALLAGLKSYGDLEIRLPVVKTTLNNGLTVLLLQDSTVPMVSYHTWFKVGSRDESEGLTGAAHMLEHMMFKGSKKYAGNEFDKILHANGIVNNAFTTHDYTGFFEDLPPSKLELIMQIESDRMVNLLLRPEDLVSEKEVVKEERRWRVDNSPMGLMRELTFATIFKVHPYRWPVIGTMKDISNYTVEKLRSFYSKYYVPNNAVLVIVGDIQIQETQKLVEKYYGSIPKKDFVRNKYLMEPTQTVQYNAVLRQDVQAQSFSIAYQSVPQSHVDMYALDLAAQILGNGPSSRLYKRLVYSKQVATSAYSFHDNLADHGVFVVGVNLKPGVDPSESIEIAYNEMWRLRNRVVTEKELKKAKILSMKSLVNNLRTIDGKARALAMSEILTGSYENLLKDLAKYNKVTAQDILRVSQKYFNQEQRTITILEPRKKEVSQ